MPKPMLWRTSLAGIGLAFLAGLAPGGVSAADALKYEPPALSALACTRKGPKDSGGRDWTAWNGRDTDVPADDLVQIGEAYANGSDRLDPNPSVARRIFQHVVDEGGRAGNDAREALAKLILANSTDPAEIKEAIGLLEEGVAGRDVGAAVALGQAYERGRVVGRNPAKALDYFRMGAAAGDPQAVLGIARLARAGAVPGLSPAEVEEATRTALATLMVDIGRGNCQSIYVIGLLYDYGDVVPMDTALAVRWYETAALATAHPKAAERLAWMYQNGVGVERSLPQMFRFLTIAAEGGRARTMVSLGEAYAVGDGTEVDGAAAIRWFERADKARQTAALPWLIRAWRGEFGTPADPAKAFAYLKRYAERPNPDRKAVYELGAAYLDGTGTAPDVEAAIATLERAASLGSEDGAQLLGDIYLNGRGIEADPLRAARYYRQAASLGSVSAMTSLADMHGCGIGVAWSPELEQRWLERAAFQGSGASMYRYAAKLAAEGDATARRFRLMRRAAMLGSREAMAEVSIAYELGRGVEADPAQAESWRNRALAAGPDAVRGYVAFAALYRDGTQVPRDLDRARQLLETSAASGDARGFYELSRFEAAYGGEPAKVRADLVAAATGGYAQAMRSLAVTLDENERAGGRTAGEWQQAAAAAGNLRARISLISTEAPEDASGQLDALANRGVCRPPEMADLALAYLALPDGAGADRAAAWLKRAEETGGSDPETLYSLGRALADGAAGTAGAAEGQALLARAAEAGLVKAMRRLADGYRSGAWDGQPDPAQYRHWVERAAAAGDAGATVELSKLVMDDAGATAEQRAKARLYLVAAAETSPRAARELGKLCLDGSLQDTCGSDALRWFARAAEQGDVAAMRQVAKLYATGTGGAERDPEASVEWLQKAAEAGEPRAMFDLASAYEAGFGTEAAPDLAAKWFAAARMAGMTEEP